MPLKMLHSTRREFAGSLAIAFGGCILPAVLGADAGGQKMREGPPATPGDSRTSLHQEVELPATAARIENALLDGKQFAEFSGMPATIDAQEGGAFSMFGGMIVGRNVEIVAGHRIVQAWRPSGWQAGLYSIAKFEFRARGARTLVVLDHTGFSAGLHDHLTWGWNEHYWGPLKKYLA
jgi:activator of HSP90 ATPase